MLRLTLLLGSLCACLQSISQLNIDVPFNHSLSFNGFIKNVGQVRDLKNQEIKSVLYSGNVGGQYFYITDKGISFLFHKLKRSEVQARGSGTAISDHPDSLVQSI